MHTLKATGKTKLYDALHQAMLELDKVKKIPNCRRRILCLTDGKDVRYFFFSSFLFHCVTPALRLSGCI